MTPWRVPIREPMWARIMESWEIPDFTPVRLATFDRFDKRRGDARDLSADEMRNIIDAITEADNEQRSWEADFVRHVLPSVYLDAQLFGGGYTGRLAVRVIGGHEYRSACFENFGHGKICAKWFVSCFGRWIRDSIDELKIKRKVNEPTKKETAMPEPKTTKLSSEVVEQIGAACLWFEVDELKYLVTVDGIARKFCFHLDRIDSRREQITELLNELPTEFKADVGGGYSFLSACHDKHGELWTGMQSSMELLFALGMAIGKVKCCLPRELWAALPGGMPYYAVS